MLMPRNSDNVDSIAARHTACKMIKAFKHNLLHIFKFEEGVIGYQGCFCEKLKTINFKFIILV